MKKKALQFAFGLFVICNGAFAQWGGSTTTSGDIYRDGNVGIGTGSFVPQKLTVAVNQQNDGIWLAGTGSKNIALLNNVTSGAWNGLSQPGDHLLFWKTPTIDDPNAGGLVIGPWCNGYNGIRISATGNVGIGTSNTGSFKLAVEGKIGAREIQVTLQNPFPDYVFASNYKLRSLASLEQYINKNKHLPGVPSAGEVEKNGGVELGQLNTKLLEKVEELTLYVIELKKENEQMKKKMEKLSKRK